MPDNRKILKDLKSHLRQNYGPAVRDVILFGSQAREEASKDSDYDILVLLEHEYTTKDEIKLIDLCYDIDLKYDIIIDVHVISKNELNAIRGKQPMFEIALRSGIYA
jgi:predicted nucleotidyltransferase